MDIENSFGYLVKRENNILDYEIIYERMIIMNNLECAIDIFVMNHRDIILSVTKAILYIVLNVF